RVMESDVVGSWNILCGYQGGERCGRGYTSEGKREKGITRYWNWQGLERWLMEGETRRKKEYNLPPVVAESFEVTAKSYLCFWDGEDQGYNVVARECLRERLEPGRSKGGMSKCPSTKKEGILLCGVCDEGGGDWQLEFGEGNLGGVECKQCGKGKAGKKKGHPTAKPIPHTSFTCGCAVARVGAPQGSLTYYRNSNNNLICGVCKEERGDWDWEYGYNRGFIDGSMYLGRFN
ncbi:hypothetical protein TrRE_jg11174, partial [Triparma retinervis]